MKEMLKFFSPYKKYVAGAVIFMLLEVIGDVMQPTLMASIVGQGIESGDTGYIIRTGLTMILLALMAIVCGFGNARCAATAGVGAASGLRHAMFEKVQAFSFKNIDDFSTASLSTRLTNDITLLQNGAVMSMRLMLRAPLMFVFALFMAIRMNSELAVVLAVAIPSLALILAFIISKAMPMFQKMQAKVDNLNSSVQENLTNVRVVKSFVSQEYEKKKFKTANDDLTATAMKAMKLVILNMPLLMLTANLSVIAVLWLGGNQAIEGLIDAAHVMAFIQYIMQILMSLMMLSMIFIMMSRASASYRRAKEVLVTEVDLTNGPNAQDITTIRGNVTFENVSFRYKDGGKPVLQGISFEAKAGEVIAIIGGTGSGKSSLVQLIPRLYDVSEGRVLVDGRDVRDFTIDSLREGIGVVLQKNTLFSGTIAQNLRWGNENATDEEVIEAAKAAQAHDFIEALPNGYDSWLEQGGVNVSGGQKQRLCIARAMLKKPAILILDDSTSAVDTATESRIRRSFDTMLGHTTVFIIAQRISSVKDADKIIILNDGAISAIGTHDDLLKNSEEYQEIYYSQQEKEESA